MVREQELVFDPTCLIRGGAVGFLATFVVFKWIGPVTSRWISSGYSELPMYTKRDWDDRLASLMNAMFSIILSIYTLLYDHGMREDRVWYDSYYARFACGIVVGYMLADLIVMVVWCKVRRGEFLGYICHHAATVYAYLFISGYGVLCYFGMLRLVAELSTPFVDFRWFFDTIKMPRSKPYVTANGFMMVFSFLFSRIFTMPIYWYQIWQITGTEPVMKLGHIMLIMYIPCLVLDLLNVFWFYKMCKGFIKAVRNLGKQSDKFKAV